MRDVRGRGPGRSWIGAAAIAAGLLVVGSLAALASGSADDESTDGGTVKKRDVQVYVSRDGEAPQAWVSTDDDDGPRGAYLGVSIDEDTKNPEGGARVDSVAEDSPAGKAGIRQGDTIVGFGGTTIRGPARLTEKIHAAKPGDRVTVEVLRKEGKKETVSVELGDRPKASGFWYRTSGTGHDAPMPDLEALGEHLGKIDSELGHKVRVLKIPHGGSWIVRGDRPRLGVELVETTPELREYLGGSKESGVLVGKVLANTPAQRSGVKVGDLIVSVDGERIEDVGALIDAVAEKEGKTIDLELVRDRKTTRIQVVLPKPEEGDDEPTGPRARLSPADRLQLEAASDALRKARRQQLDSQAPDATARQVMRQAREAVERARSKVDAERSRIQAEAARTARSL